MHELGCVIIVSLLFLRVEKNCLECLPAPLSPSLPLSSLPVDYARRSDEKCRKMSPGCFVSSWSVCERVCGVLRSQSIRVISLNAL